MIDEMRFYVERKDKEEKVKEEKEKEKQSKKTIDNKGGITFACQGYQTRYGAVDLTASTDIYPSQNW